MRSFRRALAYVNWIFNPFHRLATSEVYELLGQASPTERGLYLNLGYWRDADSIDDASDALAMLVAETAGMGPGHTVLDCGFGFADQDILWARRCRPDRIVGLNVTASQVAVARERVEQAGLADRVDLKLGSATAMPIASESIDIVVSLESAFHYDTRSDFFGEAWRVLKPGGRLVTADIVPTPKPSSMADRLRHAVSWWLVASKFVIPDDNVYGIDEYAARLRTAGFTEMRVHSIRDDVYPALHRYIASHTARLKRLHPVARLPARHALRRKAEHVYAGLDYVLARADKP